MNEIASKLRVDDEDFLVASMIDRCPKGMMLRELVMNALEAANATVEGSARVWIGTTQVDGVQKLTIRNTGPGMDAANLHRMCNIAASFGKEKGLKGNFGMGAKVASLPSNHLGVRYRSCAGGRVHEVVIGKYNGVYGRLHQATTNGGTADIIDVSSEYEPAAREEDWTEVVLFGHTADQDTLIDPYCGDPTVPSFWIPMTLYHRFYRFPEKIAILLEEGVHWHQGTRPFQSITARIPGSFARAESVTTAEGIIIHYLYDPPHAERSWENASSEGALQSAGSTAALVYRDELYDVCCGSPWAYESPKFGITFAARHISVHVELTESLPVVPDAYRQFLRYEDGEQLQVKIDDFADLVREHRPVWLLALLDEFGLKRRVSEGLQSELTALRRQLGVALYTHIQRSPDYVPPDEEVSTWVEPELEIVQLSDPQDINDRWLLGRAACFYPATRQLFVNTTYESIILLAEKVSSYFVGLYPVEAVMVHARVAATEALIRRIARGLLHGLSKAAQPDLWQAGHIEKATAPETLSIVADDWADSVAATCEVVRQRLLNPSGSI